MYDWYEKENCEKKRIKDSSKTKQRICRKGHGILSSFRDLSLAADADSLAVTRSSLWRSQDEGSLGDDIKSNASDCDSQSDDSCLWEIYRSDDTPSNARNPKSIKNQKYRENETNVTLQETPRKDVMSLKGSSQWSPISLKTVTNAKNTSPMSIASPYISPVKVTNRKHSIRESLKNLKASPKLETKPEKTKGSAESKSMENPKKKTTISRDSIVKESKFRAKPISYYFQKKKLLSSPKLKLESPLKMSTPKAVRKLPSKRNVSSTTICSKDEDPKHVQITQSDKPGCSKSNNPVSATNSVCLKRNLKRHSSMFENATESWLSTPHSEKRICRERKVSSEPRPKRKIDLSRKSDPENSVSKKARQELNLEYRPVNPFVNLFFEALPQVDLGATPITDGLKECKSCSTNRTPLWRDTEDGIPLCNACGIRWRKNRIRCTRCWYVPTKSESVLPYCTSCGHYNTVKRCNTFKRYASCIY